MSRRISDASKVKRKMGTGEGANYIPYITTSEFNSLGTTAVIKDWKTGRGVHCLSQGEALWYYILRWDDSNIDIREQYPLDKALTEEIAHEQGLSHPKGVMTTDFLVTKADGKLHAYSVKPDRNLNSRTLQLLCIEKLYWAAIGAEFTMLFKTDANPILATNIRLVTEFYQPETVTEKYGAIKHKIATKEYAAELDKQPLTRVLLDEIWQRYNE